MIQKFTAAGGINLREYALFIIEIRIVFILTIDVKF